MFWLLTKNYWKSYLFMYTKMYDCHICSPSRCIYLCSSVTGSLAGFIPGEVLHAHSWALKTPSFPFPFTLPDLSLRSRGMASVMGIKEGQGQWYSPGKPSALWLQWLGLLAECLVAAALCFTAHSCVRCWGFFMFPALHPQRNGSILAALISDCFQKILSLKVLVYIHIEMAWLYWFSGCMHE